MLEAAETRDDERAVRHHRGAGRGERGDPRLAVRDPDALDDVRRAARLEVARHVDDAEVDPVADDDAEEEPGGRVQAADRVVRETEGPGHADADREGHHDQGADPQEVEKDDAEDHRHADQADVAQVVLDVPVLLRAGDEIPGELHRDRRVEPFRVDLGDGLLDQGQDRGVPVEVPGGDGGADQITMNVPPGSR